MTSGAPRATLALLGLRASGKSTLGRLLATELGQPFVDLDEEVTRFARHAGQRAASAGELLARCGQATFRHLEAGALRCLLEPSPRIVLATGGGVVERADNRAWLARAARCLFLDAPVELLAERVRRDRTPRPALLGSDAAAELVELEARRRERYQALATWVLDCGADSPTDLLARALALVRSG